ncbi:hypothetical protein J2792_002383 [Novosphingobium capsulatum]|uniref:Uncharacterized protein n=1 Tax=Novosphingobium capsulatum TaxID=13688 RepID=A0ABU1MMF7_9SPHN|nr:hypothetical protein [Novosphingobium capsulatum]MDR6511511.1 hypothetical protein [Novosphingobium capsulatum]
MSDMIDAFRALKDMRQTERKVFGIPCPVCIEKLPKAQPKILQHGQVCRAHKPHYRDPRPRPTTDEYNEQMAAAGSEWRVS